MVLLRVALLGTSLAFLIGIAVVQDFVLPVR